MEDKPPAKTKHSTAGIRVGILPQKAVGVESIRLRICTLIMHHGTEDAIVHMLEETTVRRNLCLLYVCNDRCFLGDEDSVIFVRL